MAIKLWIGTFDSSNSVNEGFSTWNCEIPSVQSFLSPSCLPFVPSFLSCSNTVCTVHGVFPFMPAEWWSLRNNSRSFLCGTRIPFQATPCRILRKKGGLVRAHLTFENTPNVWLFLVIMVSTFFLYLWKWRKAKRFFSFFLREDSHKETSLSAWFIVAWKVCTKKEPGKQKRHFKVVHLWFSCAEIHSYKRVYRGI